MTRLKVARERRVKKAPATLHAYAFRNGILGAAVCAVLMKTFPNEDTPGRFLNEIPRYYEVALALTATCRHGLVQSTFQRRPVSPEFLVPRPRYLLDIVARCPRPRISPIGRPRAFLALESRRRIPPRLFRSRSNSQYALPPVYPA